MKKSFLILLITAGAVISSCSKKDTGSGEEQQKTDYGVASRKKIRSQSNVIARLPDGYVNVILSSNNEYVSSYGGGITFGTSLPHPITSDPNGMHDGEAIPTIDFVNWTLNSAPVPYTINGAYFVVLEPYFPAAVTSAQVQQYFVSLRNYWSDTTGTVARPTPLGSTSGSGGVKEVKGILVRDHSSPTLMSVCPDTWKGNMLEVGTLYSGSYVITVYGPTYINGTANKVKVTQNGTLVSVTSFSINYYGSESGNYLHMTGSILLTNGTTISIDNDLIVD